MATWFGTLVLIGAAPASAADPLPSWNDGPAKQAIVAFVARVTTEGSRDVVPPAARVAARGFKTYIVSGGGVELIRVFAGRVYGVPPEQVIGSTIRTRYEVRAGGPVLVRLPEIDFVDDRAGKSVAIHKVIGARPVMAFGNSDGDFAMLEWTTAGAGPRFGMLVHHTDAARESAYDRDSHFGRRVRALDEAPRRGWTVVDMKGDWKAVFPFMP